MNDETLLEEIGENLLEENGNNAEAGNTAKQSQLLEQLQKELEAARKQREEMEKKLKEFEAKQKADEEAKRKAEKAKYELDWVLLNDDFDRSIPIRKIRILNKSALVDRYCCVFFSDKPNDTTSEDTYFNINLFTLNIGDNKLQNTGQPIYLCKEVGGNWYEYEFSRIVFFSHYQKNAPRSQVSVLINKKREGIVR